MFPLPSLSDFRARGQLIELLGHRIFVSDQGSGPPVLFLHGFPTSSFDYALLTPLLASQRRLVLFDFLGYGYSDKPRQHNYSLFEQAGGRCQFQAPTHQFLWVAGPRMPIDGGQAGEAFGGSHGGSRAEAKLRAGLTHTRLVAADRYAAMQPSFIRA